MADNVASLFVEVDSKQVRRANVELEKFNRTSQKVDKGNQRLKQSFTGLNAAIGAFGAALGAREIIQAVDTYTLIENKLKNVTDTTEELTAAQEALFEISQDTRSSFESTVNLYQRLAISTQDAGVSSERLLAVTEGLQQAFIVSGATAQEANNAVIQLAQGLASGQLRGEEFRSVSEQGVRVTRALSDSLGVTIGQLREMAFAGELTTDVFLNAFEKQLPVINKEFEEFDATVGQSLTTLTNSLINFAGKLDNATGASDSLTSSIGTLSETIDSLASLDPGRLEAGAVGTVGIIGALLFGAEAATVVGTIVAINETVKALDRQFGTTTSIEGFVGQFQELNEILQDIRVRFAGPGQGEGVYRGVVGEFGIVDAELTAFFDKIDSYEPPKVKSLYEIVFGTPEERKQAQQIQKDLDSFFGDIDKLTKEGIKSKDAEQKASQKVRDQEKKNQQEFKDQLAERREALRTYFDDLAEKEEERLRNSREATDGVTRAIKDYVDEATDSAAQVERVLSGAFKGAEDSLVEFVKTGKLEFGSLVDSILTDIVRIQIQQSITGPLAEAGGSIFSSVIGGLFAKGGAFNGGVQMFANGGVVNSPTAFGMQGGVGVMGEAGPEAILPLERGPGGKLGVSATASQVNVFIENAPEGTTATSQPNANGGEDIRVIIADITDQNLAMGAHDKTMQSTFGVSRQGF